MAIAVEAQIARDLLDRFFRGVSLPSASAARLTIPTVLIEAAAPMAATQNGWPTSTQTFTNSAAVAGDALAAFSVAAGGTLGYVVSKPKGPFGFEAITGYVRTTGIAGAAGDAINIPAGALDYTQGFNSMNRLFGDEWGQWAFGVGSGITVPGSLYVGIAGFTAHSGVTQAVIDGDYYELSNEVSSGYARQGAPAWNAAASNTSEDVFIDNSGSISIGPLGTYSGSAPPAGWYWCLFDASSGGNIVGILGTPGSIFTGATKTAAAHALVARIVHGSTPPIGLDCWCHFVDWPSLASGVGIIVTPGTKYWADHVRGVGDRLLVALASAGVLGVQRYSDAVPDALAATTSVETADVSGCSLGVRADGTLDLLYSHAGAVKHRTSADQGEVFTVASTIASGYDAVTHWLDDRDGMLVAMLWKTDTWYVSVGTLDSAGTTWTFTTPASVVAGKKAGASVARRADGTYEFAYITTGSAAAIIRCRDLGADGSGSWA